MSYYEAKGIAGNIIPAIASTNAIVAGLQIDTKSNTLEDFLTKVIKSRLSFSSPSIVLGGSMIYEEGEDADEELKVNLKLILEKCPAGGIYDGVEVQVEDFTQNLEVTLLIKHIDSTLFPEDKYPDKVSTGP
eukprot:gene16648-34654_t